MVSPGNRHCANCIGTHLFPTDDTLLLRSLFKWSVALTVFSQACNSARASNFRTELKWAELIEARKAAYKQLHASHLSFATENWSSCDRVMELGLERVRECLDSSDWHSNTCSTLNKNTASCNHCKYCHVTCKLSEASGFDIHGVFGFMLVCYSERKCADTVGTVPVPWADHFQCWNFNIFSNKKHGNNFIKQHSETRMVWNYRNADWSLRQKK